MRARAAVVLTVLFATTCLRAGEPRDRQPLGPWEGAAPGDWSCLLVDAGGKWPYRCVRAWTVTRVDADAVELEVSSRTANPVEADLCSPDAKPETRTLRLRRGAARGTLESDALVLLDAIGLLGSGTRTSVSAVPEKRLVAGRTLDCLRLSFIEREKDATRHTTAWTSLDAGPAGVVAWHSELSMPCQLHPEELLGSESAGELQGFGSKTGATFGLDARAVFERENNHHTAPRLVGGRKGCKAD